MNPKRQSEDVDMRQLALKNVYVDVIVYVFVVYRIQIICRTKTLSNKPVVNPPFHSIATDTLWTIGTPTTTYSWDVEFHDAL